MPSTGTPSASTAGSQAGAPASYTELGPPESTTPTGSNLRICATLAVQGRIALNTCCSRMRLAMSWVYCPPKSSTTMPPRSLMVSSPSSYQVGWAPGAERFKIREGHFQDPGQRLAAVERVVGRVHHIVAREQHAVPHHGAQPLDVHRLLQQLFFFLDQFFALE